jgi:hypothetical protein
VGTLAAAYAAGPDRRRRSANQPISILDTIADGITSAEEERSMSKLSKVAQAGYAWAESGRSEYDVIAVVDWCIMMNGDADYDTPELRACEAEVSKRMRDAFDEDDADLFSRLFEFEDDAYREDWLLGVITFYTQHIERAPA